MYMALALDPQIRNWVLVPLILVLILVILLRHYLRELNSKNGDVDSQDITRAKFLLNRSQQLRKNGSNLFSESVEMRTHYFANKSSGALRASIDDDGTNSPMNPMNAMSQMKGQAGFMITNIVMMSFINYMFSGFILVRMPFPLTNGFKYMLQRGIVLKSLDASYVSSLSWYFLVTYGLQNLISMLIGKKVQNHQEQMMRQQMAPTGFKAKDAFRRERDSLKLLSHDFSVMTKTEYAFCNMVDPSRLEADKNVLKIEKPSENAKIPAVRRTKYKRRR